jgi:hypothetical protein
MRTILIPVDASSTTNNTARFAANWAKQYEYEHIILLKISSESMFDYLHIADGYTMVNEEHFNNLRQDTESLLKDLTSIVKEIAPDIKVSTVLSRSTILRTINESIKENPFIELIVLGADINNSDDESFVSGNIESIARTSVVRTLIVPNNYSYTTIKNVLVPCDITQISKLERVSKFISRLEKNNLKLNLLNIYQKEDVSEQNKKQELKEYISTNFSNISTDIYYSHNPNIIKGIADFVSDNPIDVIAALPGKHSFFYYLTNKSITEEIYQNINKPVMILKSRE